VEALIYVGGSLRLETRQPRDDKKAKEGLRATTSCHCERAWGLILVRCPTGPIKKGAWLCGPCAKQSPTAVEALIYVGGSLRPEDHRPRDDRDINKAPIPRPVIASELEE